MLKYSPFVDHYGSLKKKKKVRVMTHKIVQKARIEEKTASKRCLLISSKKESIIWRSTSTPDKKAAYSQMRWKTSRLFLLYRPPIRIKIARIFVFSFFKWYNLAPFAWKKLLLIQKCPPMSECWKWRYVRESATTLSFIKSIMVFFYKIMIMKVFTGTTFYRKARSLWMMKKLVPF